MHFMFSNDSLHMKNTSLIITLTVACYIAMLYKLYVAIHIIRISTTYQAYMQISILSYDACMWLCVLCLFQLLCLYSNCLGYRICL